MTTFDFPTFDFPTFDLLTFRPSDFPTIDLPTHYLCFAPVLSHWNSSHQSAQADLATLESFTRTIYPVLPQGTTSFRAALSGAEKLGILRVQGKLVSLTFTGQAVAELLPDASTLAAIHQQLTARASNQTLASVSPESAAVLRFLLYTDPVAKFLIDLLGAIGRDQAVSMRALVVLAAERDKTMTPLVFFSPEVISLITDELGQLAWNRIQSHHFRATTFMQYKSMLKHAGVIKPHRLGGISAKAYDPDGDIWEQMF